MESGRCVPIFEDMTPEKIRKDILAALNANLETREGGFLATLTAPVSVEIWKLYQAMNALIPIAYVDESSGGYIDLRCGEFGLVRKPGTRARAELTLTGKAGVTVPKDTAFLTEDGLEYSLLENVTLTGGADRGTAEAIAVGARYNIEAGELTQMVKTLSGLDVWQNELAAGGTEPEEDGALAGRLYERLRKPATSGNVRHYEQWALEVNGVGAVRVTPLANGPGTVGILILDGDRGPAAPEIVAACTEHIQALRPVGAAVTVESAVGLTVRVEAHITTDGSVTAGEVAAALADSLKGYFKLLAFAGDTLLYNRVAFQLLSIPGVLDYTSLTINGGKENLPLGWNQVPVLGEVAVT